MARPGTRRGTGLENTQFGAAAGGLDRVVAFEPWQVPVSIDVEGEDLVFEWPAERGAAPDKGMLDGFLSLADASPARIRDYARRWGTLQICRRHSLPSSHAPECSRSPYYDRSEPLSVWRSYARQFHALLDIAARAKEGKPGSDQDWKTVLKQRESICKVRLRRVPWWPRTAAADQAQVAEVVEAWLNLGKVRPAFRWNAAAGAKPTFKVGSGSLFGALAMQAALAISRTDALAACSGCGEPYIPSRKPRADSRSYCTTCRLRKVPQRDAMRDSRERLSKGRANGRPAAARRKAKGR